MLEGVEWGEYRLGDLFRVYSSKSIDEGKLVLASSYSKTACIEFVGRTMVDNGVKGYTKELDFEPNPPRVISISQIGTIVAQIRPNKWYASQNIFLLSPNMGYERLVSFFGVVSINKALMGSFDNGYSNYPTLKTLESLFVKLPLRNGHIDFEFMEYFLAELNAQRLAELNAYLSVTGLKDYKLTPDEKQALFDFDNKAMYWSEYKMEELFKKKRTTKLPYKAKELPKEPTETYSLPCLTSSFMNQGLNYYAPREGATILKNVVSLPCNSDVYRAYYQSKDFTVLSDAYAIEWIYERRKMSREQYLFVVGSINKVTDLPIYSYKNKLGGWNVVKEKSILLPTKDGKIDYEFIGLLISAIQKITIKEVVKYGDEEIKATESVILKKE